MLILPRQARDKHREISKKGPFSCSIKERHADTNVKIAQGLMEFQEQILTKKTFIQDLSDLTSVHEALDRFFMVTSAQKKRPLFGAVYIYK
jgi:hypothetical protein